MAFSLAHHIGFAFVAVAPMIDTRSAREDADLKRLEQSLYRFERELSDLRLNTLDDTSRQMGRCISSIETTKGLIADIRALAKRR